MRSVDAAAILVWIGQNCSKGNLRVDASLSIYISIRDSFLSDSHWQRYYRVFHFLPSPSLLNPRKIEIWKKAACHNINYYPTDLSSLGNFIKNFHILTEKTFLSHSSLWNFNFIFQLFSFSGCRISGTGFLLKTLTRCEMLCLGKNSIKNWFAQNFNVEVFVKVSWNFKYFQQNLLGIKNYEIMVSEVYEKKLTFFICRV